MFASGEMKKVPFQWFDSNYHDGECVDEEGEVPTSKSKSKKLISYRNNELLCFYDCQRERWQPRWEKKEDNFRDSKPYLRGCEFDSTNKRCYAHTSETLAKGNNKPNSKCMIFLTLAQEPGECIFYNWMTISTRPNFSPGKYRTEYQDIYDPAECLKKCLSQYYAHEPIKQNFETGIHGCEYRRRTEAGESTCARITHKFEGGSRLPDPEGGLNVCWKIQEEQGEKTIRSYIPKDP